MGSVLGLREPVLGKQLCLRSQTLGQEAQPPSTAFLGGGDRSAHPVLLPELRQPGPEHSMSSKAGYPVRSVLGVGRGHTSDPAISEAGDLKVDGKNGQLQRRCPRQALGSRPRMHKRNSTVFDRFVSQQTVGTG